MNKSSNCDCNHYYFFTDRPKCLHQIFRAGLVKAITRQVLPNGQVEFYIYAENGKHWRTGSRSRLTSVPEIKLAIELANKHQVKKERL